MVPFVAIVDNDDSSGTVAVVVVVGMKLVAFSPSVRMFASDLVR